MRFGVLGPLAVWTADGRPVRVPEVKVRALLADLLIHAGRVVPVDRLVDDLWGERPPANPAGALQTRVSQLRRALDDAEPGSRALLVSRPPGYVLEVESDATRFQTLIARTGEDPRTRARLLADALALWRGPALLDFADEEFARPEITRLEELRLTALEEQAEARLVLGEHALLADELGDLVAAHPLRERLRGAHLRALYRAGRQSEALDSYRDLRERLVDELGVDPGPELVALHRSILAQDPELGAAADTPRGNVPAPLTELIGREAEVARVHELLRTDRLVTLTGPGGVGKTRLAIEVARQVEVARPVEKARQGDFPDGVWVAELSGQEGVTEVVAAVLDVRDESACLADRLADALRGKRLLLVLDNCEHVLGPAAELVARLLRAAPGLRVLATSQAPLGLAGEAVLSVPALEEQTAVRLFAARATGFVLDEKNAEAVAAICRRLDGIPLALELAATRVRALGVHELARRLDDRFRVLAAGHSDAPSRQRTLRAMIDWSWELLSGQERTVLRRLAVQADGCGLEAAEHVCAEPGVDVVDVLARLVDRSLVVVVHGDEPRYRLLESVAAYGLERLGEETGEIRRRHARFYGELAATAEPQLRGPGQRAWLRRLDTEAANLRSALDHTDDPISLVNALAWYWVLRGRLGEGHRSLTAALTSAPAAGSSLIARRTAQIWQAAFALRLGEAPQELPAVDRPGELAELAALARAECFHGFAMVGIGDLAAGERQADGTLAVFRGIGDQWGIAAALGVRARQALIRGELRAVEEYGEQSLTLFAELGDAWGQLHAARTLGIHAEIVGDYERAALLHREGLRKAEDLELRTEISDQLSMLGRIALLTGDHAKADELHQRGYELAVEQGYTVGEEFAAIGLALSARRQGRLDEAEALLRRWLEWDRKIGSATAVALLLAELGFVAELRGDGVQALVLHEEGLEAARDTGDPRAIALALEGLAGAHAVAGDHQKAAGLLRQAAATRESVGAPLPEAERGDVDRITAAVRDALGDSPTD